MWRHAHRGGMRGYEHVYSSAVLVVAAVADAARAMSSSGAGRARRSNDIYPTQRRCARASASALALASFS